VPEWPGLCRMRVNFMQNLLGVDEVCALLDSDKEIAANKLSRDT
jgi:hypothetical protein